MTEPVSTARPGPDLRARRRRCRVSTRSSIDARDERMGDPAVRPRHVAVDGRPGGRRGHRGSPRLARRARSTSATTSRLSRVSAMAMVDAGLTTAVVAGMGGSSLAPDVLHRTFGSHRWLPRPAHPRLDRPGGRRAPCSTTSTRCATLVIVAEQVGHDRRAERVPRGGVASRGERRSTRSSTTSTRLPAPSSSPSPIPGRASRRSRTTTPSARSSSTHPTSAGATAR